MKRFFISLLFAFACLCSFAQDPANAGFYEIKGKVKNVPDGTIVDLFRIDGNVGRSFAKDTIIDGCFYFKIRPGSLSKEKLGLGCYRGKGFPEMSLRL